MTSHTLEADRVVVGDGLAGVCASIAAARNGARVTPVQDGSILGVTAPGEFRMHVGLGKRPVKAGPAAAGRAGLPVCPVDGDGGQRH
jgi:glycine/D-amino acid oxidase-like deaminating enzyme